MGVTMVITYMHSHYNNAYMIRTGIVWLCLTLGFVHPSYGSCSTPQDYLAECESCVSVNHGIFGRIWLGDRGQ